jgi:hypothetical protein
MKNKRAISMEMEKAGFEVEGRAEEVGDADVKEEEEADTELEADADAAETVRCVCKNRVISATLGLRPTTSSNSLRKSAALNAADGLFAAISWMKAAFSGEMAENKASRSPKEEEEPEQT